jgi:hypothetical protein
MTTHAIILPSGLRLIVDVLIETVRIGVRRFRRGGEGANAPAGEAVSLLNRLTRLLRWTLLMLAVHLPPLPPLRARKSAVSRARRTTLPAPAFPLFPRYRVAFGDAPGLPQPAAFVRAAAAPRDRVLTAQRKLDALQRALANPLPIVQRMARRLPHRLMVMGRPPPRRRPSGHRQEFYDELREAFAEAHFQLGEWRRRTRNGASAASGS